MNEIERKKTTNNIKKTKSYFFEKISKNDKPLVILINKNEQDSNQ